MIIGLTGTHGAGKGSVADYLSQKKGFTHISVSHFLADEATRRGMTPDRPARSLIADEYRKKSPTALMEAMTAQISDEGNYVIEAQYTAAEVEFIKDLGGIEIAVDADLRVRYERIQGRASEKDKVSFETFVAHQKEELVSADPNDQNLIAAIESADYTILNNGTKEELEKQLDDLLLKNL